MKKTEKEYQEYLNYLEEEYQRGLAEQEDMAEKRRLAQKFRGLDEEVEE